MEAKIACSKCNKGHAAYVPYCPYCGAMQQGKAPQQTNETKVEQSPPKVELEQLIFVPATKAIDDDAQLIAEQAATMAAKEKVEKQVRSAQVTEVAVDTKVDRGMAEQTKSAQEHLQKKKGFRIMAVILTSIVLFFLAWRYLYPIFEAEQDRKKVIEDVQAKVAIAKADLETAIAKQKEAEALKNAAEAGTKLAEAQTKQFEVMANGQAQIAPNGGSQVNPMRLGDYNLTVDSSYAAQGATIVTGSNIVLIGDPGAVAQLEETQLLVAPDGRESAPQTYKVTARAETYTTNGKFIVPQTFPRGRYTVKSTLSLDGKEAAVKSLNTQVDFVDNNLPQPAQPRQNDKVIQLLNDARKFITQGNYKQAEESMKFCLMLESENQECQQMKQKAARLNDELLDCVSSGKEWVNGRCN